MVLFIYLSIHKQLNFSHGYGYATRNMSAKWTDHRNGENFYKMDGAFKGDITATKWTDNHADKRTAHNVDGPQKRLKFLRVHEMDGHIKDKTTTKWTDSMSPLK